MYAGGEWLKSVRRGWGEDGGGGGRRGVRGRGGVGMKNSCPAKRVTESCA